MATERRLLSIPPRVAPVAETPSASPFMSLEEFGRLVGVKRARASAMAAAGLIPTVRLGRRIYVPRRALERMADDAVTAWEASRQ